MRKSALTLMVALLPLLLLAQTEEGALRRQLQLELLGPAGLWSINADKRFGKRETGLGFRFGFGLTPVGPLGKSCNRGVQISIPLGLNYVVGANRHAAELGAGYNLAIISATKVYCTNFDYGFFSDRTEPYWFFIGGYRYRAGRKTVLRAFASPLLQPGTGWKAWGGVGVGFAFR